MTDKTVAWLGGLVWLLTASVTCLDGCVQLAHKMVGVFEVIEGPAKGKRFWLHPNQSLSVGRISTADISVPTDSHMSRHHLILEANRDLIRVRDVGSANGTFVNNSRINSLELFSGDRVQAGTTIIELSAIMDEEPLES